MMMMTMTIVMMNRTLIMVSILCGMFEAGAGGGVNNIMPLCFSRISYLSFGIEIAKRKGNNNARWTIEHRKLLKKMSNLSELSLIKRALGSL